jgi:hypothetical protein
MMTGRSRNSARNKLSKLMAKNDFTKIFKGSMMRSNETITNHRFESNGGEALAAGYFNPLGMHGHPHCPLAAGIKGLAINGRSETLWAEPMFEGCGG